MVVSLHCRNDLEVRSGEPVTTKAEPEFVPPGPGRMGYQYWAAFNFHANFSKAFYYRDTSQRVVMPRYETDSETDFALEFLRARSGATKPFFLMVAPHPPHPPWRPDQTPARPRAKVALLAPQCQRTP